MNNLYTGYSANPMKNFPSLRKWTAWAGTLGILQSLTWMALTIVGIVAYTCNINVDPKLSYGSLMKTIFLDLYFKGNCFPGIYQRYNKTLLLSVPTVLDTEDVLIWDCVYLGVATFWLLSSVLILTHVKKECAKTTTGVIFSWVVFTLFICAMDLALGIIFGIDYGRFNRAAYDYNFNSANAGPILPDAAELVAGGVAAMSMMIISFKGFVLWMINVVLMLHLLRLAISIGRNKDSNDTLFNPRKPSSDDGLAPVRPPVKAYEEQITTASIYTNEAFVPDNRTENDVSVNQFPLTRAARISTDGSLQDGRFRNVQSFQQYPPPRYNNKGELNKPQSQTNSQIPVGAVSIFPAPDYSPPMSRANQNQGGQNNLLRNQRYQ